MSYRPIYNKHLIGNGRWCSCCFPDGSPSRPDWQLSIRRGCNECAGKGRIKFSAAEIVATTIAESRSSSAGRVA